MIIFLASCEFFYSESKNITLRVIERTESDHLPLLLYIDKPTVTDISGIKSCCKGNDYVLKYCWKENLSHNFVSNVNSQVVQEKMSEAIELIYVNVDQALARFNDIVKEQANDMTKRIYANKKNVRHQEWFDCECKTEKRKLRLLLRKFLKSLDKGDRGRYCIARREYKNLIKRKKKEYKDSLVNKLLNSVKSQSDFWDVIRKVSSRKAQPSNDISIQEWFEHFKAVLETGDVYDDNNEENLHCNNTEDSDDIDILNGPITREEVKYAIRKLKNGKSAGPDGLIGEFFKNSGDVVVNFLVKLFNVLFDSGVFPSDWTESIIMPLFKKGDVNDPNNYRGISLCNISSKLYSSIINKRLQNWISINNVTGEHQAGFKKGYSTIDHIFTLMAAVQKQFANDSKLYVAFVDFQKAFDSISRKLLWPILLKNGIRGKLHRCIKNMYDNVKAKIRSGAQLSDLINCTRGVKQGDVCSPLLFSLFINELALEITENGMHGVTFDLIELFILLFADDIVLMSTTVVGLQRQLNNLFIATNRLELKVNMDKTKIIVFRKGGYLSRHEKWRFGNERVVVTNMYKYLGIYFSTGLSFNSACDDIAKRAKKAVLIIFQVLYKLNTCSFDVFCKLFDSQVNAILQYGAEIWALDKCVQSEKVHLFALKRFLNVDNRTPNDFVYAELGRYPIYINSYIKCIKYWLHLTQMNHDRLPYKAYKTLYNLDARGEKTWATNIKQFLNSYGFAFVWENQGVENIVSFVKCLKQRIIDCRWQDWHDHVQTSDRFAQYRLFKTSYDKELYIGMDFNRYAKNALTKFRFGVSELACHRFRYQVRRENEFLCRLCQSAREDEIHFLLCCPALLDLRNKYIQLKFYREPCAFRMHLLLSCRNPGTLNNLATYLYLGFKRLRTASS